MAVPYFPPFTKLILMVLFLELFQIASSTSMANRSSCNLFMGSWVFDKTYPIYQSSSCPIIDLQFNCQFYARPDSDYLKYRWEPSNCQLPRFNGLDFLLKMRGKTVMFVGDSLGRNQWQSLICLTLASVPGSPTRMITGDPLSTFKFLEYGVAISFYRAPYLVDIQLVQGKRVLRLDYVDGDTWKDVDVLSFNTGHWWTHKGSLQGWDYMESGGTLYQDTDRTVALETGLRAWGRWVDINVDSVRTKVFFQSISPSHYNPSQWSIGTTTTAKSCYGEIGPTSGTTYPGAYTDQYKVLQRVINEMSNPVYFLDITMLSAMRKDAHPSIYGTDLSPAQKANPDHYADCSHWCIPGLPDTWNQLFYTAMLF